MKPLISSLIVVPLLYVQCVTADIDSLQKGVAITDDNIFEIAPTSIEYARARRNHLRQNDKGVAAFLHVTGKNDLWSLSRVNNLYLTDFDSKSLLSVWPLTRWPHQYYSSATKRQYAEFYMDYPVPFGYESTGQGPGCLGESPLRYGDIEEDGQNEIVVILDGLFIIFSPAYERTVFSEYLDESDWFNDQEMAEFFADEKITVAQYVSRLWADNSNRRGPGVRAYAKLYFGDFDEDGNPDILAWRKSYRSNADTDPVKGFTKLGDNWGHFERDLKAQEESEKGITGEYLPQETDAVTIRQWLAENELTWGRGYPSTSECEGKEGQLILEMHDPLLNDPEVLE